MKNMFFMTQPTTIQFRRGFVFFVLAALTLSLLPTPQANAMQRHRMMPISGSYDTMVGPFTPIEPNTVYVVIKQQGSARPIGSFTGTIVQTVNFSDFSLQALSTFITADGDVLRAVSTGFGEQSGTTVTFEGSFEFTGGTGKFRDARGTAHFTGSANLVTNIGHVEFRGLISY